MDNVKAVIDRLEKEIEPLFMSDSSGHDIFHLKRVFHSAMNLQKKEGGDMMAIGVAAFLHDLHSVVQNKSGKYCSPKESLPKIKEILMKIELPEDKIKRVLHCVEFHEEYNFSSDGKTVDDIETLIVQDADNLDALGAVGIARAFMYGGVNNIPMWTPKIPFGRKIFDEGKNDPSEIHHFYSKLLKLKDNMNTKTAKKIALKKHKFLEIYLKEFFMEWNGKL
ncbi:MAG: HD domain-containing protein [bacterium]